MQQENRHTCSEDVVIGGGIDSPGLLDEGDALAEGILTGCCCMAAST